MYNIAKRQALLSWVHMFPSLINFKTCQLTYWFSKSCTLFISLSKKSLLLLETGGQKEAVPEWHSAHAQQRSYSIQAVSFLSTPKSSKWKTSSAGRVHSFHPRYNFWWWTIGARETAALYHISPTVRKQKEIKVEAWGDSRPFNPR